MRFSGESDEETRSPIRVTVRTAIRVTIGAVVRVTKRAAGYQKGCYSTTVFMGGTRRVTIKGIKGAAMKGTIEAS